MLSINDNPQSHQWLDRNIRIIMGEDQVDKVVKDIVVRQTNYKMHDRSVEMSSPDNEKFHYNNLVEVLKCYQQISNNTVYQYDSSFRADQRDSRSGQ